MKIALLGYGKMGKEIEQIALQRGHEIVLKVNDTNLEDLTVENLAKADVAIEFSTPFTVLGNIDLCFKASTPIVVGTTGWYAEFDKIKERASTEGNALFHATNFSIGVNITFHINKVLAKIMNGFPGYDVQMEEIHHTQKLDHPSGTAITLAEGVLENLNRKQKYGAWLNDGNEQKPTVSEDTLLIEALRQEAVPGTHTVSYISEIDRIDLRHEAFNRKGFATGAVVAAEWLKDKKGVFTMKDLLSF
ncbi:4-hydroxy-tetrahydrodipicolinate reductase [Solitalea longa]|uniref:4-hydroxy-tetrahydrodipicolinate reductase n=1 Tax=Solitalea longa TaxID=2079460 RepID=A0A2S5A211_9SPHI|nr:4-hydroxy-tetrahydrodipicolinate reductase [Solitalea longa]POY36564.1 4-hydroxy-tetrahydrodipicolinate reductase [Solitalea longa]